MRKWSNIFLLALVLLTGACQNQNDSETTRNTNSEPPPSPTNPASVDIKESNSSIAENSPTDEVVDLDDWAGKWVLHTDEGDSLLFLSPETNQPGHLYFQLFEPRMHEDRLQPYEYSGVFAVQSAAVSDPSIFKAQSLEFIFKRSNDALDLTATGVKEYFGDHTELGGRYKKYINSEGRAINDNLIVPGLSVGKVKIGMTQEDIKHILGNPSRKDVHKWTYTSADGTRFIDVLFNEGLVVQIDFNSPSFMTDDLIGIGTFDQPYFYAVSYKLYKFQWRFLQLRYDYDIPGLSFYSFNVDSDGSEGNAPPHKLGSVYNGSTPLYQPIENANWTATDGRF